MSTKTNTYIGTQKGILQINENPEEKLLMQPR